MLGAVARPGNSFFAQPADDDAGGGGLRFLELARVAGVSRAFTLCIKLGLPSLLYELGQQQGVPGLSAADIAQRLQLRGGLRGVTDWLDVLVSLDVLQRSGDGPAALYSNSTEADSFLAKQSTEYIGGHAVLYHDRTFPQLLWMEQSLRTGVQPDIARQVVAPVIDTFAGEAADGVSGGDPVAFALGMTGCNKPAFQQLAASFDFSRYATLGDFGGSAGVLSCCVAAAHPHMRCTTHDLPAVHEAAVQYIQAQGLSGRVEAQDIDFFAATPFPSFDVISMGMILHDWGIEKKKLLMRKAFDALPPGGAFIAVECLIDDERRCNLWGLMMSLDMLMEFEAEAAFDYTFAEFHTWAAEAGFSRTQLLRLAGPNSAAIAFK